MLSAYEGSMSAFLSHRRPFARSLVMMALLLLGAGLSGCASVGDNMSSAFADPAKYDLFECNHLQPERERLAARAAELQGLMAKAETGVAGSVVAEVAYRNDLISTRAQQKLADEAWRKNKCRWTKPEEKPAAGAAAAPPASGPGMTGLGAPSIPALR
jgi:hypothetical protein